MRLTIAAERVLEDLKVGDSIAVNGVCLTVVKQRGDGFEAEAVGETLEKTNLGDLQEGDPVNLERPLRVGDRLGGHFVQGHVNGTAVFRTWTRRGENFLLEVELPEALSRYVILEGSIALDGISLTVARLNGNRVGINIIPHTASATNLKYRQPGDRVNVEVDLIAKYVERLLAAHAGVKPAGDREANALTEGVDE
ncbi:MAG: riboflavin synthase [Calditrichaeota bacterium]|nr:MAG: riboflavin synthase [Calditrichota bacterium]